MYAAERCKQVIGWLVGPLPDAHALHWQSAVRERYSTTTTALSKKV